MTMSPARAEAPPPVATALYELTEDGRDLEPVLRALGLWGLRLMAREDSGASFQAHWLAYAPLWFASDADPAAPPATIQLTASGEKAVIEFDERGISTRVGEVEAPDLVIEGPRRAVLGLLMGIMNAKEAAGLGLRMSGRRNLLHRLRPDSVPA